ncbi:ty1-copia retrotransposon protein [Cucumis melo var. makuwa]|uniref:Ty1-copia retrotransposon protein n=1 Tax=Cucumis melo var. makuwa TaxID=1194695 RepID=A0A5A7V305_CUCMM|nr:ty1-copia retrotransposon protein [Cucumis melo var. makuwa]TYK05862.1 ty1-copia retrotransposon protein [Cucumis melo var. makuwa]
MTTKTMSMENACSWETQPLQENLVSGSLMNRVGLKIVLEGDKVVLTKNEDFVGKGYLSNGVFVLDTISMNANASSSAYVIESVNLWHGRIGHVNFASIRKLKDFKLINTSESHETGFPTKGKTPYELWKGLSCLHSQGVRLPCSNVAHVRRATCLSDVHSLSFPSTHYLHRPSINWRELIPSFTHKKNIFTSISSSLPLVFTEHLHKPFVSILCAYECTLVLGSCVNLGEQPTSRLAPRSTELAFRAVVRHDTTINLINLIF